LIKEKKIELVRWITLRLGKHFNQFVTLKTPIILIIFMIIIAPTSLLLAEPIIGTVEGSKAPFYSVTLNITDSDQTTDGKNPVQYVLTIVNTGNDIDTFTVFSEITEVTECDDPDKSYWSASLDKSIITLEASASTAIILTVTTTCGCQVGCVGTITITAVSAGDPNVKATINTYTTRGATQQHSGLIVEIDYNMNLNELFLEQINELDVYVYNLQGLEDSILIRASEAPEDWSVSLSPQEFLLLPNSRQVITLSFTIPQDISSDEYLIEITAQSIKSPSIQGKDNMKVFIKPDLIIHKTYFSKRSIHEGEKVKVTAMVKNIGLASAKAISLNVFDEIDVSAIHQIANQTITFLGPNQDTNITFTWSPKKGSYNLTFWLNPDDSVNELRTDNNLRVEPITVAEALDQDTSDDFFYQASLLIIVLIFIWFVIYYKLSHRKTDEDSPEKSEINIKSDYKTKENVGRSTQQPGSLKAKSERRGPRK
jgi:uncharacterized membrane protein